MTHSRESRPGGRSQAAEFSVNTAILPRDVLLASYCDTVDRDARAAALAQLRGDVAAVEFIASTSEDPRALAMSAVRSWALLLAEYVGTRDAVQLLKHAPSETVARPVLARRVETDPDGGRCVIVGCAFCGAWHAHGWPQDDVEPGLRRATCGRGWYYVVTPRGCA